MPWADFQSKKTKKQIFLDFTQKNFTKNYNTEKGEVDFVVDKFGEREYIQVADYLSSDDVIKREFGAFKYIENNFPKYVITMDKINYSQNGIKHLNLEDFLLEKKEVVDIGLEKGV